MNATTCSVPRKTCSYMAKDRKSMAAEGVATIGLILIVVSLMVPFFNLGSTQGILGIINAWRWVYIAGALTFTICRIVGATDSGLSMRMKRLRRLEFWAGVAFCIGGYLWYYNSLRFAFELQYGVGVMATLRDTVYFTLAGAVIQILAAVMIWSRQKKEQQKGGGI